MVEWSNSDERKLKEKCFWGDRHDPGIIHVVEIFSENNTPYVFLTDNEDDDDDDDDFDDDDDKNGGNDDNDDDDDEYAQVMLAG